MMSEKLDWTQKLGDAFLAQQTDALAAVQRLRAKAHAAGNLKTTAEQKVTVEPAAAPTPQTVVVQQPATTVIKIEPTNPQVVYVPTYNPAVVYGSWAYPAYPLPAPYYPPATSRVRRSCRLASAWRSGPPCGVTATGAADTPT